MVAANAVLQERFQFAGTLHPYPGRAGPLFWAPGFGELPHRGARPRPGPDDPCPFCPLAAGASERQAVPLRFAGREYVVGPNGWPIVGGQQLVYPAEHREDLEGGDVALLLQVVAGGFDGLARQPPHEALTPALAGVRYAAYVNVTAGSGRSIPHLHMNLIPAGAFAPPPVTPAAWAVCGGVGGATISRLLGLPFYLLGVSAPEQADVALTAAALHRHLRAWGVAYNLLAFVMPDTCAEDVCLAVVPRAGECSPAADQRVAGLEFLTGVLIPGPRRAVAMSLRARDQAFRETTLQGNEPLGLERRLRAAFGLPPAGAAVFAVPQAE
jgi:hypothetical protein